MSEISVQMLLDQILHKLINKFLKIWYNDFIVFKA